jgi:hypothetical protein
MKKTFFTIVIGLSLVASLRTVHAQSDEKPAPKPKAPFLAEVPDYGHWTVTFKYEGAASSDATGSAKPPAVPDGSPMVIDTIKTGELRGVVLTFADGKSKQFTCQGDWVLASTEKGPQLSIATPMQHPYIYYTPGFVLLDGVKLNLSDFKETDLHNGMPAFHYKTGDTDVWIDQDTMLPLGVKKPGVEVAYQFLPAPPKPFDIPKDQAALLKKEQQDYKAVRSMR